MKRAAGGLPLPDSLWAATAPPDPGDAPIDSTHTCDVCVVGGGFTGLSSALHAAEAGARVILLEAAQPGWGASGRNGGQVIPGFKLDPDDIVARFGSERGERLVEFSGGAPDLVFDLIARHQMDCSARRGSWIHAVHGSAALSEESERVRQWRALHYRADEYYRSNPEPTGHGACLQQGHRLGDLSDN